MNIPTISRTMWSITARNRLTELAPGVILEPT